MRGLLPRCMLLWRNAFPRSDKELESEKARGDAFTWQVSLEARAGALSSIHSFVTSCPDLVTEDITRRLGKPLEYALKLLTVLGSNNSPIKSYAGQLKAPTATVRLRFLEVISVLPPNTLETRYADLLRLLVSEFCLSDPTTSPTSTSLLTTLLHQDQRWKRNFRTFSNKFLLSCLKIKNSIFLWKIRQAKSKTKVISFEFGLKS